MPAQKKEGTTALTVPADFTLPVISGGGEFARAFQEEMAGLTLDFVRVKIPSGGGTTFEIEDDLNPDDPEVTKEVIGVIVDHFPTNAYWKTKYTGENNPPDCFSRDGKIGIGDPGGSCKTCPLGGDTEEAWSSGEDGMGKACQNRHWAFVHRGKNVEPQPLFFNLPPGSVKGLGNYIGKVLSRGKRSCEVVTKITLAKATNKKGIVFSRAQFALAGVLDGEQREGAMAYAQDIRGLTRKLEILEDDYTEAAPTKHYYEEDAPASAEAAAGMMGAEVVDVVNEEEIM